MHLLGKVPLADCCVVGIRAVRGRGKAKEKHTKIEVFILGRLRNAQRVSVLIL